MVAHYSNQTYNQLDSSNDRRDCGVICLNIKLNLYLKHTLNENQNINFKDTDFVVYVRVDDFPISVNNIMYVQVHSL